jgi:hypothetical protein
LTRLNLWKPRNKRVSRRIKRERNQKEALKKVLNSEVATKHDIAEMGMKIENRLNLIENRFGHMEKIMWAILGGVLGLIVKEVVIHTMRG